MKPWLFGLYVLLSAPVFAQETVPVISFESVPNAVKLPPNLYFGEVDRSRGQFQEAHLCLVAREHNRPCVRGGGGAILEFGPDGRFIREIGKNLYAWAFAHTVRIDKEDNIWAVDKGSDMIVKFNPEGRVLLVFGRKQEASDEAVPHKRTGPPPKHDDGRFRQPTDVTWDAAGNTFFSDGYVNSRVAKVDKNGNWLKSWGERGDKPGEFNTPHTIAADAQGNIYVGDRGNGANSGVRRRRQVSARDRDRGALRSKHRSSGDRQHARRGRQRDAGARRAVGDLHHARAEAGAVQRRMHSRAGSTSSRWTARSLACSAKSGKQLKQFGWMHEMACPSENELYVAEVLNWRVQKLLLRPGQQMSSVNR